MNYRMKLVARQGPAKCVPAYRGATEGGAGGQIPAGSRLTIQFRAARHLSMGSGKMASSNPALGAHLQPFSGIPTFMRRPATRDFDGVDLAVVGAPFDSGTSYRRSEERR